MAPLLFALLLFAPGSPVGEVKAVRLTFDECATEAKRVRAEGATGELACVGMKGG